MTEISLKSKLKSPNKFKKPNAKRFSKSPSISHHKSVVASLGNAKSEILFRQQPTTTPTNLRLLTCNN